MAPPRTVALKLRDTMPVRTLVVRVADGADRGASFEGERATIGTARDNALALTDPSVSGYHLELSAGKEGVAMHDLGSTNGTWSGGIRLERAVVPTGTELVLGKSRLVVEGGLPTTIALHEADHLGPLYGVTTAMRRLMSTIRRVGAGNVSVLLIGESGTGKELLARALHDASPRRDKPFVTIDCGALTPSLVASELFGHEQGAFTGAQKQRRGAFELADGGTLFLDEIGELPAEIQTMLLGALERRRFCRVGGREEIEVDVRLVGATHRDLRKEVNAGAFRLDLYYRVAVVTLEVPPLRDRVEDIPLLIEHFLLSEGVEQTAVGLLGAETLSALQRHRWPGNVRELKNYVQATLAMGEPAQLRDDLEGARPSEPTPAASFAPLLHLPYGAARDALLADFETAYVRALLARSEGNVARAARTAEMARSHLNLLLKRHKIRDD